MDEREPPTRRKLLIPWLSIIGAATAGAGFMVLAVIAALCNAGGGCESNPGALVPVGIGVLGMVMAVYGLISIGRLKGPVSVLLALAVVAAGPASVLILLRFT